LSQYIQGMRVAWVADHCCPVTERGERLEEPGCW
jgi:hypothetical protein